VIAHQRPRDAEVDGDLLAVVVVDREPVPLRGINRVDGFGVRESRQCTCTGALPSETKRAQNNAPSCQY